MDITAARIAAAKATHAQAIMQAEYTLIAELHNLGAITMDERNARIDAAHRAYCDTVNSLGPKD